MKQILTSFNGDPNLGLYGVCTEKYLLLPRTLDEERVKSVKDALGLDPIQTSMLGTDLLGIFVAGNSNAIIVSDEISNDEVRELEEAGLNVHILEGKYTALGNLIVANDNGAFISELLEDKKEEIEEVLKVPVRVGKIAGLDIVGSVAIATNQGCLVHPNTTEEDAEVLEEVLKVPIDLGTVNFGSPFVKSGILANSNGMVLGNQTSGPEITRIIETLYE